MTMALRRSSFPLGRVYRVTLMLDVTPRANLKMGTLLSDTVDFNDLGVLDRLRTAVREITNGVDSYYTHSEVPSYFALGNSYNLLNM